MELTARFGLEFNPFLKNSKEILFEGSEYTEAKFRLDYLVVTVNDFYWNLAASLGAQPSYRKTENFHIIQEEINRLALDKRKTPVIIIDEANYIKNAVLND